MAVKPYLNRTDYYSLSWLIYPILCILLVAYSTRLAAESVDDGVDDAKRALKASCEAAQLSATAVVSLPRYLAQKTNEQLRETVRDSILAAESALGLTLTATEGVIGFVIDSYKGLYLCLLQFVVRGGLAALIEITKRARQYLDTVVGGLADGAANGMRLAVDGANGAVSAANDIINAANRFIDAIPQSCIDLPFPGGRQCTPRPPKISTISVPSINFDVDSIRNFQIPNNLEQTLTDLHSRVPTLDSLRNELQELVAVPFNQLRTTMNTTFAEVSRDALTSVSVPLPAQQTVVFCDGMDVSFLDTFGAELRKVANIAIGVLVAIAVLIILGHCFIIWWNWKSVERGTEVVQASHHASEKAHAQTSLNRTSLLTINVKMQHPFGWRALNFLGDRFNLTDAARDRLAWFIAFIFHPSPLTCLLVGLFGVIAIGVQLIAVKPIQRKISNEVGELAAYVTNSIGSAINNGVADQSRQYASAMNSQLDGIRTALNDELFDWIGDATGFINNTVVAFYDDVQEGINDAFGNTMFASPIQSFLHCVIGKKIETLEQAITFLRDNLHITIPRISDDVLLLSQDTLNAASEPIADAAVGGDDGGLFGRLLDRYLDSLKGELVMFGILLAIWGLVVLIGLFVVMWDAFLRDRAQKQWKTWREPKTAVVAPTPEPEPVLNEKSSTPLPAKDSHPVTPSAVHHAEEMAGLGYTGGAVSKDTKEKVATA